MQKIIDAFRASVCAQGPREGDKNSRGGCGNPTALSLEEIYEVLENVTTKS